MSDTDTTTQPLPIPGQGDQSNLPSQPQIAMSNADDSSIGRPVGQAPGPNPALAQPTPAQAQASQPSQAQAHTGWFHGLMARMNQGDQVPVRDRAGNPVMDPTTGKPQMQGLSSKQMGRSILAGALSALVASEQNQPYRNGNGVWVNPSNEAVQAGQQAFQQGRPQQQYQQANDQLQKQRTQQYATYDANIKMLSAVHALYQVAAQDQAKAIEPYKDVVDQLRTGNVVNPETGKSIYDPALDNMSPAEAEAHIKNGDITRDMMIPVDSRPILDAKGNTTGRNELYWMALHGNANIKLTPEMIAAHKELTGATPDRPLPILQYLQLARTSSQSSILGGMFQKVADAVNKDFDHKDNPVQVDFDQVRKDAHLNSQQMHSMLGLAGSQDNPDDFMASLAKQDETLAGNVASALRNQGVIIDPRKYQLKREEEKKAAGDIKPDDQPAAPGYYENARSLALRNGLTPDQADLAMSELQKTGATTGQVKTVTENIRHQMDSNINAQKNKLDPSEIDVLSDQLANDPYNLMTMKDIGGRGNQRAQILAEAAKKAKAQGKPFDIGLINQRVKYLGEYENPTGRSAINRSALNNLLQHASDLQDVSNANSRFGVKLLNTPLNAIKDQFGYGTYTQYQTVSNVLKDELSLYFAGGYAPTAEQQDTWNKIQAGTATPNQTMQFTKEIARLAMRRADTFNEGFKTNMGYDDPNLITPAAKAAALKIDKTLAQMVSKYGSGGQLGGGSSAAVQQAAQQAAPKSFVGYKTSLDGKTQLGWDGSKFWDLATGQPYNPTR